MTLGAPFGGRSSRIRRKVRIRILGVVSGQAILDLIGDRIARACLSGWLDIACLRLNPYCLIDGKTVPVLWLRVCLLSVSE